MSYTGHTLLPAIASTLQSCRCSVKALNPDSLAKLMVRFGHPDEAQVVAKMAAGPDFRGMLQQAVAFSREGEQQDWEREERTMDPVQTRIHQFVTEHLADLDERVTTQRKATGVAAKVARRKEKISRKKERGQEKLRAKKYRKSAGGKRAIGRRSKARGKLSPTALKKKGVIRHYQPQQSGLEDASFGKLVAELKSLALVRP